MYLMILSAGGLPVLSATTYKIHF